MGLSWQVTPAHPLGMLQGHGERCNIEQDLGFLPFSAVLSLSSHLSPKEFSLCACISCQAVVTTTLSLLTARGGLPGYLGCAVRHR